VHGGAHVDEEQIPVAQTFPQAPQFVALVAVFTQLPLHAVSPPVQESWHVPDTQV
jgi:hypothetical protein